MKTIIIALKTLILMTVITGIIYPLTITAFALIAYPNKASGSQLYKNNTVQGSELIGQNFSKPENFWGRPSAIANNPMPSGGSNLSPKSKVLAEQVRLRIDTIRKYHGNIQIDQIPKDLLFASASGVDPEISPNAALFQIDRIAKVRGLDSGKKQKLIEFVNNSVLSPDFLILGEKRVNVLKLNLFLNYKL